MQFILIIDSQLYCELNWPQLLNLHFENCLHDLEQYLNIYHLYESSAAASPFTLKYVCKKIFNIPTKYLIYQKRYFRISKVKLKRNYEIVKYEFWECVLKRVKKIIGIIDKEIIAIFMIFWKTSIIANHFYLKCTKYT